MGRSITKQASGDGAVGRFKNPRTDLEPTHIDTRSRAL